MTNNTSVRLFSGALGALLTTFGAYVFYEKTYVAILDGVSHERVGVVDRAESPISFWFNICTYGICSSIVVVAGVAFLFAAVKTPSRPYR